MIYSRTIGKYRLTVCSATQIGFGKKENQDSISLDSNDAVFALSICDGLGSAEKSAEGSLLASKIIVSSLLDGSFSKESLYQKWMEAFPSEPQKYNTTCKFVSFADKQLCIGGIGDGIIAVYTMGKITLFADHGHFSNQTSCIFDPEYNTKFVDVTMNANCPCVILISTDGFSEDIKENGLEMLLKAAFDSLKSEDGQKEFDDSLAELLSNWPNKTNGDDKTVAFILLEEKQ